MALFLGIASVIGWWAFPRLNRRISSLPVSQGLIAFTFVSILLYAWSAETMGHMAAITGAFLAGLWFSRTPERERIHNGIATIAYAVFVPVFFINIGLSANARELTWASGLLMVDGVLYLWARNAGNAQLAWSADHGSTWTWADWKLTTGFGCPTFLNFGRNYGGARDEFVYVYSPDSDSAYRRADRMVLARVPKDRIRERSAYKFFQRLDGQGRPVAGRAPGICLGGYRRLDEVNHAPIF